MSDAVRESGQVRRRRFASRGAWLIAGVMTLGYMFLYSELLAPYHTRIIHPVAGHLGWILGGISPLGAYVTFQLASGRSRSLLRVSISVLACIAAFMLLQFLGMVLINYALPEQFSHHR